MIAIYIDVYFFLNFAIDFLSLYSSARFLALPYSVVRLTMGSVMGGVWAVMLFFFPLLGFFNIPTAFLMVLISVGRRKVLKETLFFVLAEMFMGGIITGGKTLFTMFPESGLGLFGIITICVILSFLLFGGFELYLKKRIYSVSIPVYIKQGNNKKRLSLFIDSGNLAREVTTGRRIIFVKESSTGFACPEKGMFAIPIKTATGAKVKYGFIPDEIHFEDKKYNNENYIVVPDSEGCEFGGYDGIIGVI